MSKSLGNVVNPMDMIEKYGVDSFRYFLLSEMTLGHDASFTEEAFIRKYNADLANDLGNLVNRVLNMINRYCDGKIPKSCDLISNEDELWNSVQISISTMIKSIKSLELNQGIDSVMKSIRMLNRYLEIKAPWTSFKEKRDIDTHTTLYTSAECLRVFAVLLYPIMPKKMEKIREALGDNKNNLDLNTLGNFGQLLPESDIFQPDVLFPRIESDSK